VSALPTLIVTRGRARDPDTDQPIKVKLYLDGDKVDRGTADRGKSGHRFKIETSVTPAAGDHEVCALAINYHNGGPDTWIGCKTVTVPANWPPTGNLTEATLDDTNLTVSGTASDPDAPGPVEVRIEIDETQVGPLLTADQGTGGNEFDAVITVALDPGDHQVCAIALDPDSHEVPIGCITVTAI
jgi:hypothetical protein